MHYVSQWYLCTYICAHVKAASRFIRTLTLPIFIVVQPISSRNGFPCRHRLDPDRMHNSHLFRHIAAIVALCYCSIFQVLINVSNFKLLCTKFTRIVKFIYNLQMQQQSKRETIYLNVGLDLSSYGMWTAEGMRQILIIAHTTKSTVHITMM